MDQIDDWLQKISEGNIDRTLQIEIADKILELLVQKKASLRGREKMLIAQAVTALSTSVNSIYQPNEAGLRRCLLILHQVASPEFDDQMQSRNKDEAAQVNYAMLVTTVEIIKEEISKNR